MFGQTPTSAQPSSAFNWPVPRERELSRVHQPSPLAKGQNNTLASSSSGTSSSKATDASSKGSNLRISSTPVLTPASSSGSADDSPDGSKVRSSSVEPKQEKEQEVAGASVEGPAAKKAKKN